MNHPVIWETEATDAATRFIKDDPDGLRQVYASVDLLAVDPRPAGSVALGTSDLRRIHIGRYRVIYAISESEITIVVIHLGRVG
ncbi:MAG: type II toxin-antitoxin system RelE family toxin [Streptomyces sp.]|uniref:type II toxin-antitoxin system RelE family toxin n=1 Tax=Streptomyces sp. TaxID=1931 RepID=UPI003D6B78D9